MNIDRTTKAQLSLFTAVALWALAFVAIRAGLKGYSPSALSLFRFSVASVCFVLPYSISTRRQRLKKKHFLSIVAMGILGVAGYSVLLNSGEMSVSSSIASFIVSQTPVITTVLAIVFLKERPSFITVIGIGISCLGVALIVIGEHIQFDFNAGLLLVLLAAGFGSINSILQKTLLEDLSPLEVVTYCTWTGTLVLLFFSPDLFREIKNAPFESTFAAFFLGLVPSTLAQWCWSYGLSQTLVINASTYLYAMPLLSTAFAWLLLNEVPSAYALAGGSIALIGTAVVKKMGEKQF